LKRRFVVQRHTVSAGDVHYDLMIEMGDALVTLQLDQEPTLGCTGKRSFDHRRMYLDYEGDISGGRGAVAIWDHGTVEDLSGDPRSSAYTADFSGQRLSGHFLLTDTDGAVVLCRSKR
jgi:hypothetical protein